jgi:acetolactate synthase-1/3 small subunit
MKKREKLYILSAIVEHKPGVLYQISNMFRRRNFNIETLTVGAAKEIGLARMTIALRGDEHTLEQVAKQLNKLVDVVKVTLLDLKHTVTRELSLIKVNTPEAKIRADVINYTNIFNGHIIDVAHDSLIAEITGDSEKINAFIELMKPFGLKEIARTGITALSRGMRSVKVNNGL